MALVRRFLPFALLFLLPLFSAQADDPAAAEERRKRVEAAKKLLADDRAAFEKRVNVAIDRGVAWLRTQQKVTGNFPAFGDHLPANTYQPMDVGVNALVLLTLSKSGVPVEDKVVEKLKSWCLSDYAKMRGLKKVMVYTAATLLMALDAMYNPHAKDETDVKRDRYGTTITRKKTPCKYPAGVQSLVEELVKFLVGSQVVKIGGWRYPGNDIGSVNGDVDLSNTQYALLGLNAAARCGIAVPDAVWTRTLEYVLREQEKDGMPSELFIENAAWEPGFDEPPKFLSAGKRKARGWTYLPGGRDGSTGSMTCAGLACLAIVKERLSETGKLTPEASRRIDTGLLDGLAWLSDVFTVTDNPVVPTAAAMWHYYYLYGLERVGSLTGVAYHAKADWYRVGADHLMAAQEKNGGWKEASSKDKPADSTESAITQTCFALLFLKRATTPPTVPVTPPVLTGGSDAPPEDNRGGK